MFRESEIAWKLHEIGKQLDEGYQLKHYTVVDRDSICQKYVIEYGRRQKNDGTDPTN